MHIATSHFVLVFSVAGLVFAACQTSDRASFASFAPSASAGESSSGVGGAGGGEIIVGGGAATVMEPCPEAEPVNDFQCNHWYMRCEYGDDPRIECRREWACLAASPDPLYWVELGPQKTCAPIDSTNCPDAPTSSKLCFPNGTLCIYADGAQCGCSGPWICVPPPDAPCPPFAPRRGTACTTEGLTCHYGDCALGTAAVRACMGSVWQQAMTTQCGE